jgi:3-isopropylmalate dehydrogenase
MLVAWAIAKKAARKDGLILERVDTPMGWNAYLKFGDTLPDSSLRKALELGTVLFGGVGDPEYDKTLGKEHPEMMPEARCLLALREKMGLLLNFRPFRYYKPLAHLAKVRPEYIPNEGVHQVFIRHLLDDTYFGNQWALKEHKEAATQLGVKLKADVTGDEDIVVDVGFYKKETLAHYFRAAFAEARKLGLPLISVDKANVMARYAFWRKNVEEVSLEFPDVHFSGHQYVDSAAALLFEPKKLHGVIPCGNEHGDILSDGAAGAFGSMGLMCSSAINPVTGMAMFESGAGTAPTLKGTNTANPLGRILTTAMMLRHLNAPLGASSIENAVRQVLLDGWRTDDLFAIGDDDADQLVGTKEMGDLVLQAL